MYSDPPSKYVLDLVRILCIIFEIPIEEGQDYFAAAKEHMQYAFLKDKAMSCHGTSYEYTKEIHD